MHSHGDDPTYDPWAECRARRAARRESRYAWREARRQRRAERRERWANWGAEYGWGMDPAADSGALKAKVASMQASIDALLQRVAVLEKLATDDDRKLAADIERLRDRGSAT